MSNLGNVAAYLRISKDDINSVESNSISNQRELIKQYLKNKQYISLKEYIDDGYTGTSLNNRIGFQSLIKAINQRKIDTVIVKDISRLSRRYITSGYIIEKFFPKNNITLISINENSDIYSLKNIYNNLYSKDLSKKIRYSLKIKKSNGEYISNCPPFGYKKENKTIAIDRYSSLIIKKIFFLSLSGKTNKQISQELNNNKIPTPSQYRNHSNIKNTNKWTSRIVDRILKNPTYIGTIIYNQKKESYNSQKRVKNNQPIIQKITPIIPPIIFKCVHNKKIKFKCDICKNEMRIIQNDIICKHCKVKYKYNEIINKIYNFQKKYHKLIKNKQTKQILIDKIEKVKKDTLNLETQKLMIEHLNKKKYLLNNELKKSEKSIIFSSLINNVYLGKKTIKIVN